MPNFDNIFLKLNRADEKFSALSKDITAFCNENPITLDAQLREERLGVNLVCQMERMIIPLQKWSLELGEIIYSLRSALDNLIYVCAQTFLDPPSQPRDLQFPIIQESRNYNRAVQKIVPQLPTDISILLEMVQPYQRARPDVEGSPEHDPLILLNWISNHDKHRMPVPFLVPPEQIDFSHSCEFMSDADAAANVPPDIVVHVGPLSHGALLLEYRTKHPVKKAVGEFKIAAHVAIETPTGTQEISNVIGQLTCYTRVIVDEFFKKIK